MRLKGVTVRPGDIVTWEDAMTDVNPQVSELRRFDGGELVVMPLTGGSRTAVRLPRDAVIDVYRKRRGRQPTA